MVIVLPTATVVTAWPAIRACVPHRQAASVLPTVIVVLVSSVIRAYVPRLPKVGVIPTETVAAEAVIPVDALMAAVASAIPIATAGTAWPVIQAYVPHRQAASAIPIATAGQGLPVMPASVPRLPMANVTPIAIVAGAAAIQVIAHNIGGSVF